LKKHLILVMFALTASNVFAQSAAPQNVYGCMPLPSDSIFYARVDSLPVLALSSEYTAHMGNATLNFDSSLGVTVADNKTPVTKFSFLYTPGYNALSWSFPPYYELDRQAGSLGGGNADHHSITVQHQTCTVYEIYHDYISASTGTVQPVRCGSGLCTATSGFQYGSSTDAMPSYGTTDAAGLPLLPLLWRAHEIMDGNLHHPARFTLAKGYIQAGNPMWPAIASNGWGGVDWPAYGTHFRLMASANINVSTLTPVQLQYAQTIITALKQYGLILADIGSNMQVAVDDEVRRNPDLVKALTVVGSQIHASNLEAVDVSSLKFSAASYRTTLPMTFDPANQVMVGTPYTYLNIQAGVTGYPLQSWVNGSTDQEVNWSVQSGNIGSITADGLYTPPASVTGVVTGVLKVAAAVDATAYSTVYVRILPEGVIRVAAGNQMTTTTDHLGQVWQPNMFLSGGGMQMFAGDYPGWPKPQNATQAAELPVYETFAYTYGDDIVGNFVVPNGAYRVHLMFGQPYFGKHPANCTLPATLHGPLTLESQHTSIAQNFDFGQAIGHVCAVPVDFYMPAVVTTNTLEFALRNTTPPGAFAPASPTLSGFEIIPDPPSAHLEIYPEQPTKVAAGASLQLYAIGWYMSNSVQWVLVSGPGSISSSGLYKAPAKAPATPQSVVIEAKSTANPGVTKTITLTVP